MAVPDSLAPLKVAQVAVVAAIGVWTYRKEMLNAAGALTAVAMGAAIVLFTNIFWLLLLFSLLAMGSAATRWRFKEKEARKVAEKSGGAKGRRATRNVIANGLAPTLVAVASPVLTAQWGPGVAAVAYASAVAVAASDTLASEFGSLATRVRMITTLKPVPAGTDGGVSLLGQLAAVGGGAAIGVLAAVFCGLLTPGDLAMPLTVGAAAIVAGMGFLGCQVDSVLGATLETRGLINKEEVNMISIVVGTLAGLALAAWVL